MTRLACLFLGHLFNAAEWEVENFADQPVPTQRLYKNACLRCGDLVFRRIRSIHE